MGQTFVLRYVHIIAIVPLLLTSSNEVSCV